VKSGELVIELPKDTDERLVEAGFKGSLGPLKMATILRRYSSNQASVRFIHH